MAVYEEILQRAIDKTMEKCNVRTGEGLCNLLSEGDCCIHNYFRYFLAYEICNHLASFVDDAVCGYIYGSSLTDELRRNSDINIIFHVRNRRPELLDLARELDEGITKVYCEIASLDEDECTNFIDITIVDDHEIIRNDGKVCVLCSVHEPPLRVWECEAQGSVSKGTGHSTGAS